MDPLSKKANSQQIFVYFGRFDFTFPQQTYKRKTPLGKSFVFSVLLPKALLVCVFLYWGQATIDNSGSKQKHFNFGSLYFLFLYFLLGTRKAVKLPSKQRFTFGHFICLHLLGKSKAVKPPEAKHVLLWRATIYFFTGPTVLLKMFKTLSVTPEMRNLEQSGQTLSSVWKIFEVFWGGPG